MKAHKNFFFDYERILIQSLIKLEALGTFHVFRSYERIVELFSNN